MTMKNTTDGKHFHAFLEKANTLALTSFTGRQALHFTKRSGQLIRRMQRSMGLLIEYK